MERSQWSPGHGTERIMGDQESEPESRINIKDVPEQISRIFFGSSHPGGGRPSYFDDSYGAPPQNSGYGGINPVYYQGIKH